MCYCGEFLEVSSWDSGLLLPRSLRSVLVRELKFKLNTMTRKKNHFCKEVEDSGDFLGQFLLLLLSS